MRSDFFDRSAASAQVVEAGREQHLDEVLGDARAERRGDRAVEHGDAAERRDRVRGERALPGLLDRRRDRDAARVRVLDDHDGRQRELAQDPARRLEVGEVVVRELLAAELLDLREQVPAGALLARSRRPPGAGSRRTRGRSPSGSVSVSCSGNCSVSPNQVAIAAS